MYYAEKEMHCDAIDYTIPKLKHFFPRNHNYDETVATYNQVKLPWSLDSLLKNRYNHRLFLFNFEMR